MQFYGCYFFFIIFIFRLFQVGPATRKGKVGRDCCLVYLEGLFTTSWE